MTTDVPEPVITGDQAVSTQSRNALKLARLLKLLTYRKPVEVRAEASIEHLRAELGPDVEIPEDDGLYYWIYVPSADGQRSLASLVPEGEVVATCRILALIKYGPEVARRFEYRKGVIPG